MKNAPQLIGVVHLPALAGAPGGQGSDPRALLEAAGFRAVQEARALEAAGFDAVILENFGDAPFYSNTVPPETIASLSVIAAAVREAVRIPIGINVLRNDGRSALAIAGVTGCEFVRINALTGVIAADQGLIQGDAAFLMRERARLGAATWVLADVLVKHARTLSADDLTSAMEDCVKRGLADGVIVSGSGTGKPVESAKLELAARIAADLDVPVYVGSGASIEALSELKRLKLGIIVSSALRTGGRAGAPLDIRRVKAFSKEYFKKVSASKAAKKGPSRASKKSR